MPSSKFSSFHEAKVISVRCPVPGILTSDLLAGWSLLRLPCGAANMICILGAVNGKSPRSGDSNQSGGLRKLPEAGEPTLLWNCLQKSTLV